MSLRMCALTFEPFICAHPTCASNSSRKYFSVVSTGFGAVWPRPQRLVRQSPREFFETLDSPLRPSPVAEAMEDFEHPLRADAAEGALATGLVLRELQEEARHVHHARGIVHHDQAAGTHHRAELRQLLVVNARIEQRRGNAAAGWAADLHGLELGVRP